MVADLRNEISEKAEILVFHRIKDLGRAEAPLDHEGAAVGTHAQRASRPLQPI